MRALRELRRVILIKSAEGNQGEVRDYIAENRSTLARAFHVPIGTLIDAVEGERDDHLLATKFLETITRGEALLRQDRKEKRTRSAQSSAEAIGAAAHWEGEKVWVDVHALLSSALTRRNDLMVFAFDGGAIAVHQSVLFDLARLKRRNLSAFVDHEGVHVRWSSGGLNLYPQPDSKAEKVIVPLPAAPVVVAA